MKTLVLYANYSSTSSYYDDWNDAFINDNDLDCDSIDICTVNLSKLSKNIKLYDFIVMLHSTNADSLSYSIKILNILNERKGKLAVFAGNEVNIPSAPVLKRISFFEKLNPDYIFTQLFEDTGRWLYSSCTNSKVVSVPHALNTKVFKSKIELKNRKIDIGVRSYKYDVHLGDNDRNNFFTKVEKKLKNIKLVSDISFDPNKRFTRDEWAKFLQNSKATIATEAGSYYLEKNDNFINLIQEYLSLHRSNNSGITIKDKSRIVNIYRMLPKSLKEYIKYIYYKYAKKLNIKHEYMLSDEISYEKIYSEIIEGYQQCPYYSKAISSRHFDAIGTKTCLIMLEGRYNDILLPNEHYLEVRKDYSNLDEVIDNFNNIDYINKIVCNTWDYIEHNHTHSDRIVKIKGVLET